MQGDTCWKGTQGLGRVLTQTASCPVEVPGTWLPCFRSISVDKTGAAGKETWAPAHWLGPPLAPVSLLER